MVVAFPGKRDAAFSEHILPFLLQLLNRVTSKKAKF